MHITKCGGHEMIDSSLVFDNHALETEWNDEHAKLSVKPAFH